MNHKVLNLIFSFTLCLFINARGQTNSFELSKIIPESPNAASLGTFGNNSKGSYTGAPEISIPLLQTNVAKQNINIQLSYDASGTRTAQDASWAGLGWSLSYGGGVITRTVRGLDDLYTGGYHVDGALPGNQYNQLFASQFQATHPADYNFFQSARNLFDDTEPDLFTFSFGDHNGKFVFDKAVNGSGIIELEASNLRITYVNPGWKIIDGEGNSYYFNTQEWATDYSLTTDYDLTYDAAPTDLTDENINRHPITTAWYIDSIVTATSQKITYSYSPEETYSLLNHSEQGFNQLTLTGSCSADPNSCFSSTNDMLPSTQNVFVTSRQILDNKLPQKILFDNGSIEFHTAARSDVEGPDGYIDAQRLTDFVEKDKNGSVLKQFRFYHSYFNGSDPANMRLKLDSVKDITDSIHPHPPYVLSYFNPNSLPPKDTKAIDAWGYFNNQTANTSLLPTDFVVSPYYMNFAGGNRLPDTAVTSLENGVLSSIVCPTGGQTSFNYELNEYTNLYGDDQYNSKDSVVNIGISADGTPDQFYTFTLIEPRQVTFRFDYHEFGNPDYFNEFMPAYAFLNYNGSNLYTFSNVQVNPGAAASYIDVQTVYLPAGTFTMQVTDVTGYSTSLSAEWTNRTPITLRKGGGLRIKRITNWDKTGTPVIKKFLYDQSGLSTGLLINPVAYNYDITLGNTGYFANELCVGSCTFVGSYLSRSSSPFNTEGFNQSALVGYGEVTELSGENGEGGRTEYYFYNQSNGYNSIPSVQATANPLNGKIVSMKVFDATNHLLKKIDNVYATNSSSTLYGIKLLNVPYSTNDFLIEYYNNIGTWITQSKQTETNYSGNDSSVTVNNFYYTNILHKQITKKEQLLSNGDTLTYNYKYPTDYQSIESYNQYNSMVGRNILDPIIERTTFKKSSTILEDQITNYQFWNDTSFLAPVTVQAAFLGSTMETRLQFNGYDANGNLLEQQKASDVKEVYLWGYLGQYPVAKILNTTYSVASTHITQSVLDNPPDDATLRAQLNNLRSIPGALVTSYTYKPLVGITSVTDPQGKTSYYEYDAFNRLKDIKDLNGNMIKTYDYHYAQ
jgi:YD repeat-containing protein